MKINRTLLTTAATLCITLLLFSPAAADADNTSTPFAEGTQCVKSGDYSTAVLYFNKALENGLRSGALYYNIGVCYYKIKNYLLAEQAFAKAAEYQDMMQLANYNRGLVALRSGQKKEAYDFFSALTQQTAQPKLAKLAEIAIDKGGLAEQFAAVTPWIHYISVGGGYDDNVKITSESDVTGASGEGDSFSELLLFSRGAPAPTSKLQAQFNVFTRKYINLDEYDVATPGIGFFYVNKTKSWEFDTGLQYHYTFLDHERYEQVGTASVKLTKLFNNTFKLNLNYFFSAIEMLDPAYEVYDGTRNRFEAKAIWSPADWRIFLGYSLEINNTDESEYAPTRNLLSAGLTYHFTKKFSGGVNGFYRYSLYDYPKGSPDRKEDYFKATSEFSYRLPDFWYITVAYTYYDNDSNYDTYDYKRRISMLSLSKIF